MFYVITTALIIMAISSGLGLTLRVDKQMDE